MIKTHASWSTRELLNISQAHSMLLETIDKIPWTWSISLLKSSYIFLLLLLLSCSIMSDSLWPHGLQSTRLLCPWDFPGKNTRVGCHFLLQRIFPTQGSKSPAWQVNSLPLHYLGSPRHSILTIKFTCFKCIIQWFLVNL